MNPIDLMNPIETVERRDRFTKHYLTGYDEDGNEVYNAERYPGPIHYERDGEWLDIKPEWVFRIDGYHLVGVPYNAWLNQYRAGVDTLHVVPSDPTIPMPPEVEDHRVWWRDIAPQTDAVLIACATGLQLHLVLYGPEAPREWAFHMDDPDSREIGGRDNIELYTERESSEKSYELEVTHEVEGNTVTKAWTGRVKAIDPLTRRKSWSENVAYPVRLI